MAKKVKEEETFSYCIGRTWDEYPYIPKSNICVYTYGGTVFHGTTQDAIKMKNFIENMEENRGYYFHIYKLVKVEE